LNKSSGDPYFDELLAQHRRIRRFLPRLVRTVGFGAMPAGQPVLKALQHLRKVEEGGVRGKAWPTEFVPKSWERRVIRNGIVDRHAWTLCLVDRLRGALRRRDVFAAPSLRFGNPRIGYTWEHDQFLLHIPTKSPKRMAIEAQPTVYFTVDDKGPGIFGVRGKARAAIDPDRERLRKVLEDQWDRYTGGSDTEARRLLMSMVETGDLILAVLTPRYLATWGL